MRVLLIGHAVSPVLGSEPGLTWNWAWHLSAEHEVWLIAHPHFREPVERHLADHPNPRLRVAWVALPRALDPWRPEQGERGLRAHYLLWLRAAHRRAARLVAEHGIDIAHHVSLGTVGAPPPFWKLPVPFVWGPLGGGQTAPSGFRDCFGGHWAAERLRALRLALLERSPGLKRCARAAACALATNEETAAILRRAGARDVRFVADNGIAPDTFGEERPPRQPGEPFRLLWAGRMEPRKGLPVLLHALSRLGALPVEVTVAGDGPALEAWRALTTRLALADRVRFVGRVPATDMPALFARADAFAFTSLRDSLGSVTLEALARGVPLVTLDHQGQRALIPADAAAKVPADDLRTAVDGFATALRRLVESPEECARLSAAGRAFARTLSWDRRARAMTTLYEEVRAAWSGRVVSRPDAALPPTRVLESDA
ncbi:glycosyltransferase family 4 protein [Azospirillum sp. sgz302134]